MQTTTKYSRGSAAFTSWQLPRLSTSLPLRGLRSVIVAATPPNNSSDNTSSDSNIDWDSAWKSFKREVRQGIPETEQRKTATAAPPRFNQRREWNGGSIGRDIRRQEGFLLNLWTKESFSQAGIALVAVLFLSMLVLAGPPPSDGRCTLPWC